MGASLIGKFGHLRDIGHRWLLHTHAAILGQHARLRGTAACLRRLRGRHPVPMPTPRDDHRHQEQQEHQEDQQDDGGFQGRLGLLPVVPAVAASRRAAPPPNEVDLVRPRVLDVESGARGAG
jgi:hypothetical protein